MRDRALADLALAVVWRWPGVPIGRDPPRPSTVGFLIARENMSPGGSGKAGRGATDANPAFGQNRRRCATTSVSTRIAAKGLDPSAAPPQGRRLHRRVPDLRQASESHATPAPQGRSRPAPVDHGRNLDPAIGGTTSSAQEGLRRPSESPALRGVDFTRRRPNLRETQQRLLVRGQSLSRRDSPRA